MMIFELMVRGINGPTVVDVRVRDGVTEILSTGCSEIIRVRDGEEVLIATEALGTIDVPIRIRGQRSRPSSAEMAK